jgi:predicted Rossmann-fold nucleotide-binding protein
MTTRHTHVLDTWLHAMPGRADFAFEIDRKTLYRVPELYRGYDPARPASWSGAFDYEIYRWFTNAAGEPRRLSFAESVAARVHDTSIGEAILGFIDPKVKIVGFMGGHDIARDAPVFREVVLAARALREKGFMIVSGGGPGLMEAANFGAFMAGRGDAVLEESLAVLRAQPDFVGNVDNWLKAACAVRTRVLGRWDAYEGAAQYSLGIPTWLYGHEPPNVFASHIAKYFFNSVREDGLVTIADGGIVFGPGSAGTVQEVFQDANLNYYLKPPKRPTPMVLLGVDFWNPDEANDASAAAPDTKRKPVFALLKALAAQSANPFAQALLLTDDGNAVVDFICAAGSAACTPTEAGGVHGEKFKGRAMSSI